MNKLIITDEEIKLEESDELIEVTISDKLDIFDVTKIKILLKENTKLKIEHHIEKETKMDITFELEPDITLDTLDFKYGNDLKIQYHYYLKKNSKLNIIKFYDCNNIKELDLVNLNGENANIDYNLKTGKLQLSVGSSSTDTKTIQGYIAQAQSMATVLDSGNMPVKYSVDENQYVLSDITKNDINTVFYVMSGIVAIALIVLVIKYKMQGLLGAISYIGLVAIFSLILRYTNVVITIEGIAGIAITLIMSYIFINKLLAKLKGKELNKTIINSAIKETYKEFFIAIIPIIIASITFSFISWEPISSFGMVMFWGIVLIAAYNISISNLLLKLKASNK